MLSAIIPTLNRFEDLRTTLEAINSGERVPDEILVVGVRSLPIPDSFSRDFPIKVLYRDKPSAAGQRNLGAREARGSLLLFVDDDITPRSDCLQLLVESLQENHELAGIAGHMEGSTHAIPHGLLKLYYRLQAGYAHPDYGARIFGPAITTFPCYETAEEPLIFSQWLNSALVLYRRDIFNNYRFPDFDGYSPFEDAYLSASIARTHRLAFHRDAYYQHRGPAGTPHSFQAGKAFIKNLRATATDALQLNLSAFNVKLILHKLFIITHLIRNRPRKWIQHATGVLIS